MCVWDSAVVRRHREKDTGVVHIDVDSSRGFQQARVAHVEQFGTHKCGRLICGPNGTHSDTG
jgi:hypothetical protein